MFTCVPGVVGGHLTGVEDRVAGRGIGGVGEGDGDHLGWGDVL